MNSTRPSTASSATPSQPSQNHINDTGVAPFSHNASVDTRSHWESRPFPTSLEANGFAARAQMASVLPLVTIYMQDFRNNPENPEHYLAELRVPLQREGERWLVSADDMIRRLQGTPGRIDAPAKLMIRRGLYKQLFCRLSTTGIEKCNPETLRLNSDMSIELIVECCGPPPSYRVGASPLASPAVPAPLPTPSPKEDQLSFPTPGSASLRTFPSIKRRNEDCSEDDGDGPQDPAPSKKSRPVGTSDPTQQAHILKTNRANTMLTNNKTTALPSYASTSSAPQLEPALARPRTLTEALDRGETFPFSLSPAPSTNTSASRAAKQHLANATIVPWLRSQIQLEDGYDAFVKSKGKILTIVEALKVYRFAKRTIEIWNGAEAPEELVECAGRKITKALDRQTSWGSDAEMTLLLVERYGPGSPEEHPKIVEMMQGKFGPDEREGAVLFLTHLKRIDAEKRAAREAAAAAALAATQSPREGDFELL
ncbi:hypothetical protein FRB97_000679 [Tulasnella sp. 331]|nr:hypothetical protein FRB97_000679 [Tulasnella sp. 331]